MSFSAKIKNKLCGIEPSCRYCTRSELTGIIGFLGEFSPSRLKIVTENRLVAERIAVDLHECIGINAQIVDGKTYRILIEDDSVLENLRAYMFLADDQTETELDGEMFRLDCCRASYIRGAFLGGGCVLDPNKSYHLEFDTKYKNL